MSTVELLEPPKQKQWIGTSMLRVEDPKLLTGKATYGDDITLPGMLRCAIVRSPYPHARITRMDFSRALELPGVFYILTGKEISELTTPLPSPAPPGFTDYCLPVEKVTFAGQPVVAIAAKDLETCEDAKDLVEIEYEPLPYVTDTRESMGSSAPILFDKQGTNVCFHRVFKYGKVDAQFEKADIIVSREIRVARHHGSPMEPSVSIASYDRVTGEIHVWSNVHQTQMYMGGQPARILKTSPGKYIHASPYTGGAFGTKVGAMVYDVITSILSMKTGRPVKYVEDRQENLSGNFGHAPERIYEVEAAVKKDGRITALKIKALEDIGGSASFLAGGGTLKPIVALTGPYRIEAVEYDVLWILTNKNPLSPYRGLGQGPHNFMLERIIEAIAKELKMDPIELRRRNFIKADEFPYTIPTGNVYDSGDYQAVLDLALKDAQYEFWKHEQSRLRKEGRHIGIGVAFTVEPGALGPSVYALGSPDPSKASTVSPEWLAASILASGEVHVQTRFAIWGTSPDTTITQVMADELGVDPSRILVNHVDSAVSPITFGPSGSRGCVALSDSAVGVAEKLKDKMIKIAANVWRVPSSQLRYERGSVVLANDPGKKFSLEQLAQLAYSAQQMLPEGMEPGLTASFVYNSISTVPDAALRVRSYHTMADGCQVVVLEVDPQLGKCKILKYVNVEDCGTQINPKNVEAQAIGGIAQAIGLAFLEQMKYEEGQLVTASFMDYLIPSFVDVPASVENDSLYTPSPFTKTGAKGVAEGSFMTGVPAIVSAVEDALRPFRAEINSLPMTPESIWDLIRRPSSAQNREGVA